MYYVFLLNTFIVIVVCNYEDIDQTGNNLCNSIRATYSMSDSDGAVRNCTKVNDCKNLCRLKKRQSKSTALQKCAEYHRRKCGTRQRHFPWERSIRETGYPSQQAIVADGIGSSLGQFPHMALLGYGSDVLTAEWSCGGSIISENFLLTAGHCTSGRDIGPVKFAATGILKRSDPRTDSVHRIKRIIKHPDYRPPHKYNDIALLETETKIIFNRWVSIACLNINDDVGEEASATGWGATKYGGENADILQSAKLYRFSNAICRQKYPPFRLMRRGFDSSTQLCYGHQNIPMDTCQGDSGGPLQIKTDIHPCLYTLIGVTSFGRACGVVGEPGIYTRVSAFVPWIESIIWP